MTEKIIKDKIIYRDINAEFIDFAIKKTERLTSALYLVSDLIPSTEPLRTLLREKGIGMLSDIFALVVFRKENKSDVFLKIMASISAITSLLKVASVGGFISEMNTEILQKEYRQLHAFFASRDQSFEQQTGKEIVFKDTFFEESEWPRLSTGIEQNYKGQHKDKGQKINKRQPSLYKTFTVAPSEPTMNEDAKNNVQNAVKKENIHNDNFVQEERKKSIVELIKDSGGNVNIKDISIRIKGCSEKTLQRDLISLMQKGVLKKTGERRWSRYFLA